MKLLSDRQINLRWRDVELIDGWHFVKSDADICQPLDSRGQRATDCIFKDNRRIPTCR